MRTWCTVTRPRRRAPKHVDELTAMIHASSMRDAAITVEYNLRMLRCMSNALMDDPALATLHQTIQEQLVRRFDDAARAARDAYDRTRAPRRPATAADVARVVKSVRRAVARRPCIGHACDAS